MANILWMGFSCRCGVSRTLFPCHGTVEAWLHRDVLLSHHGGAELAWELPGLTEDVTWVKNEHLLGFQSCFSSEQKLASLSWHSMWETESRYRKGVASDEVGAKGRGQGVENLVHLLRSSSWDKTLTTSPQSRQTYFSADLEMWSFILSFLMMVLVPLLLVCPNF